MSTRAHASGANVLRQIRFAVDRFRASARAGAHFVGLRRGVRFAARSIDQDGVLLLMRREPSFALSFVPLVLASAAVGAVLAGFG